MRRPRTSTRTSIGACSRAGPAQSVDSPALPRCTTKCAHRRLLQQLNWVQGVPRQAVHGAGCAVPSVHPAAAVLQAVPSVHPALFLVSTLRCS